MSPRYSEPQNLKDHIGLAPNEVRLSPYSTQWPLYYAAEIERIAAAMNPNSTIAAHIGSTAVPGMKAKPIIDILLGLKDPLSSSEVQLRLQKLGYVPHGEKGVRGRLFFTCGNPCQFHLHLVEYKGAIWEDHLLFRERLKSDARLAAEYEDIKSDLAEQFPSDRDSYTRGKADFIENAIKMAMDPDQYDSRIPEDV